MAIGGLRRTALALGFVTSLVVLVTWGGVDEPPVVRDEVAYLLQAEIFAMGVWRLPPPEHPEFFDQAHVIVDPVVASKYPPGHSLVLTPGVLVGAPGLMPILLTGLAAALLYVLSVSLTSRPAVGFLGWIIFVAWRGNVWWRLSYYSELTTSVLWLGILILAVKWEESQQPSTLGWIALLTGLAAVTRPLTALALAIPLGVFIVVRLVRRRQLRQLVVPILIGTMVLILLPLWAYMTLGTVSETPLGLYTAQYMPWDRLGFGLDSTVPSRALPPDLVNSLDYLLPLHAEHTWTALPVVLLERVIAVISGAGWGLGWILAPLILIGFWRWWKLHWLIPASVAALFFAYVWYAHALWWNLYYVEAIPLMAMMAAFELHRIWRIASERWSWLSQRRVLLQRIGAAFVSVGVSWQLAIVHEVRLEKTEPVRETNALFSSLGSDGKIGVLLSYGADYRSGISLQRYPLRGASSRVVRAIDRGSENRKLIQAFPDRSWYRFDADNWTICHLGPKQLPSDDLEVRACSL